MIATLYIMEANQYGPAPDAFGQRNISRGVTKPAAAWTCSFGVYLQPLATGSVAHGTTSRYGHCHPSLISTGPRSGGRREGYPPHAPAGAKRRRPLMISRAVREPALDAVPGASAPGT